MTEIHYIRNTQRSQSLIERQSRQSISESWSGVRQGLEAKLAGIQEQKAQLEDKKKGLLVQMNQAGFATEADLEAQITSLTKQKADLDAKEKALLQQEQTLAAQEEELLLVRRQTDYRRQESDRSSQIPA